MSRLLPRPRHVAFCLPYVFALLTLPSLAVAAPWISAGDERSRHHLQVLADGGHIESPLTSWPVMWNAVSGELVNIDTARLNEQEFWSYQYLRHELRRARRSLNAGQQLSAHSSLPGLTDFGTRSREPWESRSYVGYTGDSWAFQLQGTVASEAVDDQRYRLDGSYLAGMWGNWALGVGAIDRWWGPGWQSSLILSNSARPSPGFFLQRVEARPFRLPVLEWLGPWDLHVFANQLESDRATADAKLLGMRVTFKPFQPLELGLSRTAQWGGEGRPEDFESLWNMLIGRDNRGGDGLSADGSDEPGNQLGGADWRLSHSFDGIAAAFYGQVIGEDEAGGLPSHVLGMAGLEASFMWGTLHNRLALETSNTTMEFNNGGSPNVAYEHPRYPYGYRYNGRPLAASTDNDSELVVLKGFHSLSRGHRLSWTLGSGNINADRSNRKQPGGSVFGAGADLWYATAEYSLPVTTHSQLSVGAQYYSEPLAFGQETAETGVFATYKVRL